ncbi:MAG: outer rane efflux protein [Firmicutes bacterium]|nr:outer rane efflux protein [Bacillota bacterium]
MQQFNRYFSSLVVMTTILCSFSYVATAAPGELSLDDSVALAIKNNPTMKMAEAEKNRSAWNLELTKADKRFSFGYEFVGERSNKAPSFDSSLAPIPAYGYYENEFKLTLPLYTGGKLESKIAEAKLGSNVADDNIDCAKQQLRLETTTAYFNILAANNLLTIAKQSVGDFSRHLENVQHKYDVGLVAMADVLQTKVKLAKAQDGLVKAQNKYDLAVYKFNNVVGLPLRNDTHLKEELAYQPFQMSFDECVQFALRKRPEITAVQAQVAIAKEQIKLAESANRPTVGLVGAKDWQDVDFAGTKNGSWTVMLVAQMELFDSGRTDAQIKKAECGVRVAEEKARQLNDNISLEVSQAYQDMKEAEKRIEVNKISVEQAEWDFNIAQERYEAGMGINLDVVDAELTLTEVKTDYIQALYDYNASKARLDKAMGVKVD